MSYYYAHGRCETEQDAVVALDDFLTNTVGGWTRIDTVTDISSDRDYVWSSPGTSEWVSLGGDPIYIRMRGYNDELICSGYRTYTDSLTYTFQILHDNDTHVDLSSYWFRYWFFGDESFVCCVFLDEYSDAPVSCYMGLIRSYYDIERDDYPLLIKGMASQSYSWTYYESTYMHDCTTSGQSAHENMDWWNILQYDLGVRSGDAMVMLPVVIVNQTTGEQEMRGEPFGVFQINGKRVGTMDAIATASGVYITAKFSNNNSYCNAFGPVASGISSFDMWEGDAWVSGVKV